ncbi:MAG TPA: hypothetical protein VFS00_06460 [Polyangiaceae bacterium]|nr:hypothetical protein [Polyangiaceae bacterium]
MAPSYLHEGLVALLRERPDVVIDLVREAHRVDLAPASLAHADAADLTWLDPAERRADLALLCLGADGAPAYGLVVEVQLDADPDKAYRWPAYAAVFRDRRRCPVDVVVVCVDDTLARTFAEPIRLGHGDSIFRPLVLGPAAVPILTDRARAAREPELATLSALAHHAGEGGADVVIGALEAANGLDERRRGLYADLIWSALGDAARRAIEAKMAMNSYQYQSDFAKTYFAQGKAEGEAEGMAKGEAKALLTMLEARGLKVTAAQRERVLGCLDLEQLEAWVRRAVAVETTAELFGPAKRRAKAPR